MRWPLRYQIMLPMIATMVLALAVVSGWSAHLASRRVHARIQGQLRDVAQTLSNSSFPLTDGVLRQMRGLSGAEYALVRGDALVATSDRAVAWPPPTNQKGPDGPGTLELGRPLTAGGKRYFSAAIRLPRAPGDRTQAIRTLWVYYPESSYAEARRQAIYPPLMVAGVGLLIAFGLSAVIASRVTRPIHDLRKQVEQIAQGDFRPLPMPPSNDEVRDLARSVNRLAETLARYEQEIRQSERLRTLGQLGAGVAHQMRNAVTGCRMALDLHLRECPLANLPKPSAPGNSPHRAAALPDSVDGCPDEIQWAVVAHRQLKLMEQHIHRLLSLGLPDRDRPLTEVDLVALIGETLPLVAASADHVGVALKWQPPPSGTAPVRGIAEDIEQVLLNLLLNAIEATAGNAGERAVEVRVAAGDHATQVSVCDSGPGPPPELQARLFEPFVSGKSEGTGLGLAVARNLIERLDGQLRWRALERGTCFEFELPNAPATRDAGKRPAPRTGQQGPAREVQ